MSNLLAWPRRPKLSARPMVRHPSRRLTYAECWTTRVSTRCSSRRQIIGMDRPSLVPNCPASWHPALVAMTRRPKPDPFVDVTGQSTGLATTRLRRCAIESRPQAFRHVHRVSTVRCLQLPITVAFATHVEKHPSASHQTQVLHLAGTAELQV